MKRTLTLAFVALLSVTLHALPAVADTTQNATTALTDSINNVLSSINQRITYIINETQRSNEILTNENARLRVTVESLSVRCTQLSERQTDDRCSVDARLKAADISIREHETLLSDGMRNIRIATVLIVIVVVAALVYMTIRIRHNTLTISRMQHEAVDIDAKLLELLERRMEKRRNEPADDARDEVLAQSIADGIVRIEQSLRRIDSSAKGYKRLKKAVKRMRETFESNGYQIVELLGKHKE